MMMMTKATERDPEGIRKAGKIRLLLLDVDGVMTAGQIVYDEQGHESKIFDVSDGTGIGFAQSQGIRVGILSGRVSRAVEARARELKITLLRQGSRDKLSDGGALARQLQLQLHQVAFLGDEVVDVPLLRAVGFSAAVANARPEVKELVDHVTVQKGGEGAVRELIEYLLKAQGKWDQAIAPFMESPPLDPFFAG